MSVSEVVNRNTPKQRFRFVISTVELKKFPFSVLYDEEIFVKWKLPELFVTPYSDC